MRVDCAMIVHQWVAWLAGLGSQLTLKLGLDWVQVNLILELTTHQMIPIDFEQGLTNDQFNAATQQKLRISFNFTSFWKKTPSILHVMIDKTIFLFFIFEKIRVLLVI